MFFNVKKPEPTRQEILTQLRNTIEREAQNAINQNVHPKDVLHALEDATNNLRFRLACTMPVPEAASAALYDAERRKIIDKPKPAPTPRPARLRYPQSNEAADVAAYWNAMEARQRGR